MSSDSGMKPGSLRLTVRNRRELRINRISDAKAK